MAGRIRCPRLMGINYLDSSLRVETLSFEEAADFNPRAGLSSQ